MRTPAAVHSAHCEPPPRGPASWPVRNALTEGAQTSLRTSCQAGYAANRLLSAQVRLGSREDDASFCIDPQFALLELAAAAVDVVFPEDDD